MKRKKPLPWRGIIGFILFISLFFSLGYGLVSMIDDRVFGDIDSFRSQFTAQPREQAFAALRYTRRPTIPWPRSRVTTR